MKSGSVTGHEQSSGETAVVVLPHDANAPALARRFVEAHRDHLPAELIDDAQLLASEIVTNAVRYGQANITLTVSLDPPRMAVAVADTGPSMPDLPAHLPPQTHSSGRGLLIVDAIADAWGVRADDNAPGKSVWFELRSKVPQTSYSTTPH